MPKWLENCQICNDGLRIRFEELKKEGLGEREIAKTLAAEAYQNYPELKDEFSADRIRMRYRYHTQKEVEEFLPPEPMPMPRCEECGTETLERGGLCSSCKHKKRMEFKRKATEENIANLKKAQKEFDALPIDLQAEADWTKLADQLEGFLTQEETKTGTGKTIVTTTLNLTVGKISREAFDRVQPLLSVISHELIKIIRLSVRPEPT